MQVTNFSMHEFERFISDKELLCVDRYETTKCLENKMYKSDHSIVFAYERCNQDGGTYIEMICLDDKHSESVNEQIKVWKDTKRFWKIENFKDKFPWGTVIKVLDSNEPELQMGMLGRVGFVDDDGTVQMLWNNGCKRNLNIESDVFMRIY